MAIQYEEYDRPSTNTNPKKMSKEEYSKVIEKAYRKILDTKHRLFGEPQRNVEDLYKDEGFMNFYNRIMAGCHFE